MYESCLAKQDKLKNLFSSCHTLDDRYQKIIDLGKSMPKLAAEYRVPENLVKGCQSLMYLHTSSEGDIILFEGESDALISQGLAALLINVYSGESPETVLKCPPTYLDELQIPASLSPNRANGLYSLHLRMKQEALKLLMKQ
ncbi:MAG: SufE family protein [Chlamydiales bacterium]|nr:SufE family protein [Chlamydiales bacterium]